MYDRYGVTLDPLSFVMSCRRGDLSLKWAVLAATFPEEGAQPGRESATDSALVHTTYFLLVT